MRSLFHLESCDFQEKGLTKGIKVASISFKNISNVLYLFTRVYKNHTIKYH